MNDEEWFVRVDPDHRFLMEKDAFTTFLTTPFTPFTKGLLCFVLRNLFVRLFIYDYIPVEKWTDDVCDTVCEVLKRNPSELIFIPLIIETKPIYMYVIDNYPRCFRQMIPFFAKDKLKKRVFNDIHAYYLNTQNRPTYKKRRKHNDWTIRKILKKKK